MLAGLSVTAMTGAGGTLLQWYVTLSALSAALVMIVWWRYPASRPQARRAPMPRVEPGRAFALVRSH